MSSALTRTQVARSHAWRVFEQWCLAVGCEPLPITDGQLRKFGEWLAAVDAAQGGIFRGQHVRQLIAALSDHHEALTGAPPADGMIDVVHTGWRAASSDVELSGAEAARYLSRGHVRALLAAAAAPTDLPPHVAGPRVARDLAVVHLLYAGALYGTEVGQVRVADADFSADGTVEIVVRTPHRRIVRLTPAARRHVCAPCAIHQAITVAVHWDENPGPRPAVLPTSHVCVTPLPHYLPGGYLVRAADTRGHLGDGVRALTSARVDTIVRRVADHAQLPGSVRERVSPAMLRNSRYAQCAIDSISDHEILALFGDVIALTEVRRHRATLFPWVQVLLDGQTLAIAPLPATGLSDRGAGL